MAEVEAVIVASCPDVHQDNVTEICKLRNFQKAYGRAGDMVDSLKGKDWVGKWQVKVVMAAVTKAQSLNVNRVKIICIEGGKFCNDEYASIPHLKTAIVKEWNDSGNTSSLRVECSWVSFEHFAEDYGSLACSDNTSPAIADMKKGKQGKKEAPVKADTGKQTQDSKLDPGSVKSIKKGNTSSIDAGSAPVVTNDALSCENCHRSFASIEALMQHIVSTDHSFTVYFCKGCDDSFSVIDQKSVIPLNRCKQHQNSTGHRGYRRITTSVSALTSGNQKKGKDSDDDDEEWECGECQKTFRTEKAFSDHQRSTGHKDPTCMVCEKSFGSQMSLEQHLQATGHAFIYPIQKLTVPQMIKNPTFAERMAIGIYCLSCKITAEADLVHPDFVLCKNPDCPCYFLRIVREHPCNACGNGCYLQHRITLAFQCCNCCVEEWPGRPPLPTLCASLMPLKYLSECSLKELKAYCTLKQLNMVDCVEKKDVVGLVYRHRVSELPVLHLRTFATSLNINLEGIGDDRDQIIRAISEVSF